jgi:flagellar biosynthesis protein FliQ
VNSIEQDPQSADRQKGIENMSGSSIQRTMIAIVAALTVSALAVGVTVSPAQAGTIQISRVAHG